MGMCANYYEISDEQFKEIESSLDVIYDFSERGEVNEADILLTGESAMYRLEDNLLSNMVVGKTALDNKEILIGYTEPTRVKEIAKELDQVNFDDILKKFNMQECKEEELYPNIWDYEEETEEIMEDLTYSFDTLNKLYHSAAEHNHGVLVMID